MQSISNAYQNINRLLNVDEQENSIQMGVLRDTSSRKPASLQNTHNRTHNMRHSQQQAYQPKWKKEETLKVKGTHFTLSQQNTPTHAYKTSQFSY